MKRSRNPAGDSKCEYTAIEVSLLRITLIAK
jgi:hypothetical protein